MGMNLELGVPSLSILQKHFKDNGGLWLRSTVSNKPGNGYIFPMIINPSETPYKFRWMCFDYQEWDTMSMINWDVFTYTPISMDLEFIPWEKLIS